MKSPMKTLIRLVLLGNLLIALGGCRTSRVPPRIEIKQVVNTAFGLPLESSLQDVLVRVNGDLPEGSGSDQVLAYVNAIKQRAPVTASIGITKKGELIVQGVPSKQLIEITLRDSEHVHEVSFLFVFGADDRLAKVTYSTGVFEK